MKLHDWLYDQADRTWHCAACAKPVTGRGPTRPPSDEMCAGESAFRSANRRWGRWQEDGGGLDEVVMVEGMAHLERMDTGAWFLGLYPSDGRDEILVNLFSGPGPRMVTVMLEEAALTPNTEETLSNSPGIHAQVRRIVDALTADELPDDLAGLLAEALERRRCRRLSEPVDFSSVDWAAWNRAIGLNEDGTEKADV